MTLEDVNQLVEELSTYKDGGFLLGKSRKAPPSAKTVLD
jgi:hypothetical protein